MIIERDLQKLGDRFDRHLEIYASNGKELASLKTAVEGLRLTIEKQEKHDNDSMKNIWHQTKANTHDIAEINVSLGKIMTRVSLIAAVAATVASSLSSTIITNIF